LSAFFRGVEGDLYFKSCLVSLQREPFAKDRLRNFCSKALALCFVRIFFQRIGKFVIGEFV